jgi:hypothetical protein
MRLSRLLSVAFFACMFTMTSHLQAQSSCASSPATQPGKFTYGIQDATTHNWLFLDQTITPANMKGLVVVPVDNNEHELLTAWAMLLTNKELTGPALGDGNSLAATRDYLYKNLNLSCGTIDQIVSAASGGPNTGPSTAQGILQTRFQNLVPVQAYGAGQPCPKLGAAISQPVDVATAASNPNNPQPKPTDHFWTAEEYRKVLLARARAEAKRARHPNP